MNFKDREGVGRLWTGVLTSLVIGTLVGSSAVAGDGVAGQRHKAAGASPVYRTPAAGTLGYGSPGVHPGFQGFGLGYHRGFGYGGDALGVGASGGYPFYGGPGYPHPGPWLRRVGGINPFLHYGGLGHPTPTHPNFFGGVGPLVDDPPVVTIAPESGKNGCTGGFGPFTGAMPYPESAFAPFTAAAAASGTAGGGTSFRPASMPAGHDRGGDPE